MKKRKIIFVIRSLGIFDIAIGIINILSLLANAENPTLGTVLRVLLLSFTYLLIGAGLIKLWPPVRLLKLYIHGFLLLAFWIVLFVTQFIIFGFEVGYEIITRQLSNTYGIIWIFLLLYSLFVIIFFTRPSVKQVFKRNS